MTSQTLVPQSSQSTSSSRLPLQGNCAAELEHLQADAEALLQQLQALKEQRLSTMQSER